MTFICTPGMQEKVYFEEWQKRIVQLGDRDSGWNVEFYKDYVGEIQINQLDRQNQTKYQVTIIDPWPKTINAQEFTLSSNDSYQTVSVDFAYRYWFRSYLSMAVHVPPKPPRPYIDRIRGMADPKSTFEKPGETPNTPPGDVAARLARENAATARINATYGRLSEVGLPTVGRKE
jgi:hypothetical protein